MKLKGSEAYTDRTQTARGKDIDISFLGPKMVFHIYNVQHEAWYNDTTSFSIEMIALKFVPLAKDRVAAAYKRKIHKTTE